MTAISMALALLGGMIGAGFASGQEILRFFAVHGRMASATIAAALLTLFALLLRLPAQFRRHGASSLMQLCRIRLGRRFGFFCGALFMVLFAVTGAAMLAALAELGALLAPIRHAYALSMVFSLLLALALAVLGFSGLALPGMLLLVLLPALLLRLLALPAGEACFLPAADLPVRALCSGASYGALSAAQLSGLLVLLSAQPGKTHLQTTLLFSALLGVLLVLGTAVCQQHMPAIITRPLPYVWLSRALGASGYQLVALSMYAAALSTLCAMLRALMPAKPAARNALTAALCCLLPALLGFDALITHAYPLLGALCAGLLLVLCMPVSQKTEI